MSLHQPITLTDFMGHLHRAAVMVSPGPTTPWPGGNLFSQGRGLKKVAKHREANLRRAAPPPRVILTLTNALWLQRDKKQGRKRDDKLFSGGSCNVMPCFGRCFINQRKGPDFRLFYEVFYSILLSTQLS